MKDGAVLANAGHFDVEIDLDALRRWPRRGVRAVRPLVEQYVLGRPAAEPARRAAGSSTSPPREGHPAAVMDVSFATQALARRGARARARGELGAAACTRCPAAIDREVARLKLASLGVAIDELTPEQARTGVLGARPHEEASRRMADGLQARASRRCAATGAAEAAIATFRDYYERLRAGETGLIPESEIEPVERPARRRRAARPGEAERATSSTAPWSSSSTAAWARAWA